MYNSLTLTDPTRLLEEAEQAERIAHIQTATCLRAAAALIEAQRGRLREIQEHHGANGCHECSLGLGHPDDPRHAKDQT